MLLFLGYIFVDEKKINMMKVNFFFVLYVLLIEMLIDNYDYIYWNWNFVIVREKGKKSY